MEIKTSELRAICNKIFDHLEHSGAKKIKITEDYYWNISNEELYDMSSDPKELDVGQLTEDWDFLKKYLSDESRPITYSLVWLSSILRFIGWNEKGHGG